jgi:hypothetical protein
MPPALPGDTRLLGWSMTKGVMNALVGILVRDGRLSLYAPVRMPEWSTPGDPRDLLRRKRAAFRSSPSGSMITSPV